MRKKIKIKNIILTGFMGSGKTTVGQALAKKINFKFIDTDEVIQKKTHLKISEIFEKFGEKYFRHLETEILKELKNKENMVIATGGGIILKKINVQLLKKMGLIIFLKVSPKKVLKRIGSGKSRPLLNVENRLKKIKEILQFRKEKYLNSADLVINTDKLLPFQIVKKIVKYLKELKSE